MSFLPGATAYLDFGLLFLAIMLFVAGLIVLIRIGRGIPWYAMLLGVTGFVICAIAGWMLAFGGDPLTGASEPDWLIHLLVLWALIPLSWLFFLGGFCAWSLRAARVMARMRELEYLDANLSAELARLAQTKDS